MLIAEYESYLKVQETCLLFFIETIIYRQNLKIDHDILGLLILSQALTYFGTFDVLIPLIVILAIVQPYQNVPISVVQKIIS